MSGRGCRALLQLLDVLGEGGLRGLLCPGPLEEQVMKVHGQLLPGEWVLVWTAPIPAFFEGTGGVPFLSKFINWLQLALRPSRRASCQELQATLGSR